MNKTKILVFFALSAILFACGSQDGGPPVLRETHKTISPFDTLVAEFDTKIVDIDKLGKIIFSQEKVTHVIKEKELSSNKLYFVGNYGKTRGPKGIPYFVPATINESITFPNLKNEDGYVQKNAVLHYSTYQILDKEPNNSKETANIIDSDAIKFAGILEHEIRDIEEGTVHDDYDYYKLVLKAQDTLFITIENREPLNVKVIGPEGIKDTTFSALKNKSNVFTYIVSSDYLIHNQDPVSFYLSISDYGLAGPTDPNPYLIDIKVARRPL